MVEDAAAFSGEGVDFDDVEDRFVAAIEPDAGSRHGWAGSGGEAEQVGVEAFRRGEVIREDGEMVGAQVEGHASDTRVLRGIRKEIFVSLKRLH